MNKNLTQTDSELFLQKLAEYKKLLDADIQAYSKQLQKQTLQDYGAHSRIAVDAYLDILARGGKRIRGALAIAGYEMAGGQDRTMIVQAGRALEMIHAYLLIMDDIQDRSLTRRGGSTAHISLARYHEKKHLSGDAAHYGISIALNSMGIGNHAAQATVTRLDVSDNVKVKALELLNEAIITTAHGQTSDIMNEVNGPVTMRDVNNVLEWKTAHYTFLNPLAFGMTLAGVNDKDIESIKGYALNAGRAFQITDDILGTFGTEFESGKSPFDDIKEGKRTILTLYALEHAEKADKNFLIQMLGNQHITQTEFNRCKDILIETGALDFAKEESRRCVQEALGSLDANGQNWSNEGISFLRGLAQYLIDRKA
jgi:geranylgeranyl diphosphate synthase type I